MRIRKWITGAAAGVAALMIAGAAHAGPTLDAVKERGSLQCGVNTGLGGFSIADSKGRWVGLDVDFCRAVAAAVLGDSGKVEFTPLNASQRFTALQSKEIDILSRNTTWTITRDSKLGFNFVGVNFYDGQGFLVAKKLDVKDVKDLNGATICVQPGTTTELNLADFFRKNNIKYTPVVIASLQENLAALFSGRCDAFTTDASGLASVRIKNAKNPEDWVILPQRISKEPLGPVVRHGDDEWFDIVQWTHFAMIEAEELGINSKNVDEKLKSDDPVVKRLLGTSEGMGKAIGLDDKWAYRIIKQVGNYGESYKRNITDQLGLERGLNDLWTRGGLMYAPPIR